MDEVKKPDIKISAKDLILLLSEGSIAAYQVLIGMMSDTKNFIDNLLFFDSMGIKGELIYRLSNDCCKCNKEKFKRTLTMLRCGIFTEEQIQLNLCLPFSIPFIDDSIVVEGVPNYGEDFGPDHKKWKEFCEVQKATYIKDLDYVVKRADSINRRSKPQN